MHLPDEPILDALEQNLSQQEVARVLVGALKALDAPGRARLCSWLGEDTADTVRRVFGLLDGDAQPDAPAVRPGLSKAKVLEQWERACSDWEGAILEADDEEGAFVEREDRWDPPFFDVFALSARLEDIAERLAPLIERVVEARLDPEFDVSEQILESVYEIGSGLPEWFSEPDWSGFFGPQVTRCVLAGRWFAMRSEADRPDADLAFAFIDGLRTKEETAVRWTLHGDALVDFVLGMTEEAQRAILDGLQRDEHAPRWATVLGLPRMSWFKLRQALAKRWNPARFLSLCRAYIGQEWELALPVLEGFIARGAYEDAEEVIEEALDALLDHASGEPWSPTTALISEHRSRRSRWRPETELPRLLRCWATVAERMGKAELRGALRIQESVCEDADHWDAILDTFADVRRDGHEAVVERLFSEWKFLVSRRCISWGFDDVREPGAGWIPLLLDGARAGDEGSEAFVVALSDWIWRAGADADTFRSASESIKLLTLDLGLDAALHDLSPSLRDCLTTPFDHVSDLDARRRDWLGRLGAAKAWPALVEVWRRQVAQMVPDPGAARGSRYDPCACWLAAVYELNRKAYDEILAAWQRDHRRRRNLWKAISARGLPVPK